MCLAFPGKVKSISGDTAIVDFNGIEKETNMSLVKAKKDDFVVVHAGFAIQIMTGEEAEEVFNLYEEGSTKNQ